MDKTAVLVAGEELGVAPSQETADRQYRDVRTVLRTLRPTEFVWITVLWGDYGITRTAQGAYMVDDGQTVDGPLSLLAAVALINRAGGWHMA